jgi:hypothetical protein
VTGLVVVDSVISEKTTSHENLSSELGWVLLDIRLSKDCSKGVSGDVELIFVSIKTIGL